MTAIVISDPSPAEIEQLRAEILELRKILDDALSVLDDEAWVYANNLRKRLENIGKLK